MAIRDTISHYFKKQYWKIHYKKILYSFSSFLGFIWLLIEIISYLEIELFMDTSIPSNFFLIALLVLIISIIKNKPKLEHEVTISDTDIKLRLVISDCLNLKGDLVIATNSTFDTTFKNNFISPKSIQGQFMNKYYSDVEHLDKDLDNALDGTSPIKTLKRTESKKERYKIGTVAKLSHSEFRSYWVAMADVNESGKPSSSLDNFKESISSLWEFIATKGHLENIVMPILGSGKTGINIKREQLLQEIVYSFVSFASSKKFTEELTIAIHPNDLINHKMNFIEICSFVDYVCKYQS